MIDIRVIEGCQMKYEPCCSFRFLFFLACRALLREIIRPHSYCLKIVAFIFSSINHLTSVFIYHLSLPFSLSLSHSLFVLFLSLPVTQLTLRFTRLYLLVTIHSEVSALLPHLSPCGSVLTFKDLGQYKYCYPYPYRVIRGPVSRAGSYTLTRRKTLNPTVP